MRAVSDASLSRHAFCSEQVIFCLHGDAEVDQSAQYMAKLQLLIALVDVVELDVARNEMVDFRWPLFQACRAPARWRRGV